MNELMNLINSDTGGWLCSGDDSLVTANLFQALLKQAVSNRLIQVVIASEDMQPMISRMVEADAKNRGYLPSYAWRYFPAFSGRDTDMKERMETILEKCRMEQEKTEEVMAYIDFLMDLDRVAGELNHDRDEEVLQKYLRASAVERTLNEAVASGRITMEEYGDWMADYADCASGRIHLKRILDRLARCFALNCERSKSIEALNQGERLCFIIRSDMRKDMKELLFEMIGWDVLEAIRGGKRVSILVLEGNKKYGDELLHLLNVSSEDIYFSFFTKDFFSGHTKDWREKIDEYFRRYIYTAHARMESCEEISARRFGQIPVVKDSYACDRDRRISSNRFLDQLFNTNRVDHYVQHVPVWEPLYRKEEIHGMQQGVCLLKTEGFEGYIDLRP